jgi:hypothetical protein
MNNPHRFKTNSAELERLREENRTAEKRVVMAWIEYGYHMAIIGKGIEETMLAASKFYDALPGSK